MIASTFIIAPFKAIASLRRNLFFDLPLRPCGPVPPRLPPAGPWSSGGSASRGSCYHIISLSLLLTM